MFHKHYYSMICNLRKESKGLWKIEYDYLIYQLAAKIVILWGYLMKVKVGRIITYDSKDKLLFFCVSLRLESFFKYLFIQLLLGIQKFL